MTRLVGRIGGIKCRPTSWLGATFVALTLVATGLGVVTAFAEYSLAGTEHTPAERFVVRRQEGYCFGLPGHVLQAWFVSQSKEETAQQTGRRRRRADADSG
jgi:hypothetical protein